jgi:hypothetical protein
MLDVRIQNTTTSTIARPVETSGSQPIDVRLKLQRVQRFLEMRQVTDDTKLIMDTRRLAAHALQRVLGGTEEFYVEETITPGQSPQARGVCGMSIRTGVHGASP